VKVVTGRRGFATRGIAERTRSGKMKMRYPRIRPRSKKVLKTTTYDSTTFRGDFSRRRTLVNEVRLPFHVHSTRHVGAPRTSAPCDSIYGYTRVHIRDYCSITENTGLLISFNTRTHACTHTPRIAFTSRGQESFDVASNVRETLNGHSRENNAQHGLQTPV